MYPLIVSGAIACLIHLPAVAAPLNDRPETTAGEPDQPDTQPAELAAVYNGWAPEATAAVLKKLAAAGPEQLDLAAEILLLMKERLAARALEAVEEPAVVAQLIDRTRHLRAQPKRLPVAPAPRPVKK